MTELQYINSKIEGIFSKIQFRHPDKLNLKKILNEILAIENIITDTTNVKYAVLNFIRNKRKESEYLYLLYDYLDAIYKQCLDAEYQSELTDDVKKLIDNYFDWVVTMPFYKEVCSYYSK